MVTIGFALIILGVPLAFGSSLYAIVNNFFGGRDGRNSGFNDMESNFGSMFQKHIGAIAGLSIGGFMLVTGIVLAVLGGVGV